MKLDSMRLAHTAAIVTAAFYVICALLVSGMPGIYYPMMRSWFHGIDFPQSMMKSNVAFGTSFFGLVTMSAIAWITAYIFSEVYNAFGKRK